jgi:small subunit ribosomal protein S2
MTLIKQLLGAGVHIGHKTSRWNPKMLPYIYTADGGKHVIDLVHTSKALGEAVSHIRTSLKEGKQFLFIGTKREAALVIAEEAKKCGCPYVNHRWAGGTLTNWSTIKGRVQYLRELIDKEDSGALDLLPEKEATRSNKKCAKLVEIYGGLTTMSKIPDVAIIVDPR